MPEIAEVHRIVHYCRKHLVGRAIAAVNANEDRIVYLQDKTGLDASKLKSSLTGKTVVDAKQQGKYFWLEMDSPPHLLMHFGMTGWMKFSNDDSAYYKPMKERKKEEKLKQEQEQRQEQEDGQQPLEAGPGEEWPPRFWKFELLMEGNPKCFAAFIDARRLGRVRLIDTPGDQMRKTSPLAENGPDPVVDSDIFTIDWLKNKLRSKKVPVKALLLDQANISGIGNWVADEALYQAKLHPEQYSNTFSDAQVATLHAAIVHVCTTACDVLADSSKFPDHWIMRYRWGKGKKGENKLPNGNTITWITVGGRTSAVVPAVQKKTAAVAGDVEMDAVSSPPTKPEAKSPPTRDKRKSNGHAAKAADAPQKKRVKVETEDKAAAAGASAPPSTAEPRRRSTRNRV